MLAQLYRPRDVGGEARNGVGQDRANLEIVTLVDGGTKPSQHALQRVVPQDAELDDALDVGVLGDLDRGARLPESFVHALARTQADVMDRYLVGGQSGES